MTRLFISHSSLDNDIAERVKSRLTQHGFDQTFLDFDKHTGFGVGDDWERRLYRELEWAHAIIVLSTPNWHASKWCFAEFTQSRALGKPVYPIIVSSSDGAPITPEIQHLDLSTDEEAGWDQLIENLKKLAINSQQGFRWDSDRSPYPGLLPFEEEDAAVFFGRDDEVRKISEKLNALRVYGGAPLLAIHGASGSGKSSLIKAGVVPRLKRDASNWIVLPILRPGTDILDELARSLAITLREKEWIEVRRLLEDPNNLHTLFALLQNYRIKQGRPYAQFLLVIDQAEELFTSSSTGASYENNHILPSIVKAGNGIIVSVATIRSEYLSMLQSKFMPPALIDELSLAPLPTNRISQIIEAPARVAGVDVEPGLVNMIVADANVSDALPLVAFVLNELNLDRKDRRELSINNYLELGDPYQQLSPIENAVRKRADEVVLRCNPTEKELSALRSTFIPGLALLGITDEYVKRKMALASIPPAARRLVDELVDARLLVVRSEQDEPVLEVAHDALLRKWPRLKSWLDEEREVLNFIPMLDRTMESASKRQWFFRSRYLLNESDAKVGRQLRKTHRNLFNDSQLAFIKTSGDRHAFMKVWPWVSLSLICIAAAASVGGFYALHLVEGIWQLRNAQPHLAAELRPAATLSVEVALFTSISMIVILVGCMISSAIDFLFSGLTAFRRLSVWGLIVKTSIQATVVSYIIFWLILVIMFIVSSDFLFGIMFKDGGVLGKKILSIFYLPGESVRQEIFIIRSMARNFRLHPEVDAGID